MKDSQVRIEVSLQAFWWGDNRVVMTLQWQPWCFWLFRASVNGTAVPAGQSFACCVGGYASSRIFCAADLSQTVFTEMVSKIVAPFFAYQEKSEDNWCTIQFSWLLKKPLIRAKQKTKLSRRVIPKNMNMGRKICANTTVITRKHKRTASIKFLKPSLVTRSTLIYTICLAHDI